MSLLFGVAFTILILSILAGGLVHGLLVSRLRRLHPETWEKLGRPRILLALSISTGPAMGEFLWKGAHRDVADAGVRRLVRGLQVVTVVSLALLVTCAWLLALARI